MRNSVEKFILAKLCPYRDVVCAVFLLGIAAYGLKAFNPAFVGDDWNRIFLDDSESAYRAGRWVKPLLWTLFGGNLLVPAFSIFFCLSLTTLSGVVIAQSLGARNRFQIFVFTCLIVFHPIIASHYVFYSHHIATGCAYFFLAIFVVQGTGVVSGIQSRQAPAVVISRAVCSGFFLSLAAGIRQTFFLFAMVLSVGAVALQLFQEISRKDFAPSKLFRPFMIHGLLLCLGFVLYWAFWWTALELNDLEVYKSGLYSPTKFISDTPEHISRTSFRALKYVVHFFFNVQHLWPVSAKYLFLFVLLVYCGSTFRYIHQMRPATMRNRLFVCAVFVLLLVALFLCPWLLSLVVEKEHGVRYTALLGLIPVYAVVFLQTLLIVEQRLLKDLISICALLVITIFVMYQSVASTSQFFNNQRDRAVAQRIITRLETHPGYADYSAHKRQFVILLGRIRNKRSAKGLPFCHRVSGRMGSSAACYSVLDNQVVRMKFLVRLIDFEYNSFRRTLLFLRPQNRDQLVRMLRDDINVPAKHGNLRRETRLLLKKIKKAHFWPASDSVFFHRNMAFVKLSS